MRILVAEDEQRIARDLEQALAASGYLVECSGDGEDAWFRGDSEDFDGVVLDLGLPGLDGMTILKRWREAGRVMPVVVLTARGRWTERVEGIDAGADDYLAKPFQMQELLARLRAVLRRAGGHATSVLEAGPLRLDTRYRLVTVNGAATGVTPLEYRLLAFLLHNRGRVASQLELTQHLYSQDFERESNAIEVLVGRLRRKLGCNVIQTRRGYGYTIAEAGA